MAEILEKLRPDRDLQCYFERPSAIAALSAVSENGFTLSGTWRQQFDWAVIEWNRDNVFEHPAFRYLPDGDLSGLELTYEETRNNCIPIDSDLYPTVDWPYLRVWVDGVNEPYRVPLLENATPIEGEYQAASLDLELTGSASAGDYIGLSWLTEQYNCPVLAGDSLEILAGRLAWTIGELSPTVAATATGAGITLTSRTPGSNWNRIGVYGFASHARSEVWQPWWGRFSGGSSPSKWRIALRFTDLRDTLGNLVPTSSIRKMRWTYAADLQAGAFQRSEFEAAVSNWTVTGNRGYVVAGPGSRRIEDNSADVRYEGTWSESRGNYSGGTIRHTVEAGARTICAYRSTAAHRLLLGTRKLAAGAQISASVDGGTAATYDLRIPGEDVLARVSLGEYGPGDHEVIISSQGPGGAAFYFDFIEVAVPSETLPEVEPDAEVNLATDWDTDHSICLAPERTAWLIRSLGFHGRVNHYVGAMWFYELARPGHSYASGTVEFVGAPQFGPGEATELRIGRTDDPQRVIVLNRPHLVGDTAETIAKAFELEINRGYTAIRAEAQNSLLTIYSRAMGIEGNKLTLAASPESGDYHPVTSGAGLTGGVDGEWRTDLTAMPRVNRAARDWTRSFFAALRDYGMDGVCALSMELQHGDPSVEAGIAQRCPAGDPVLLPTPALQTNFSPTSLAFWRQAHLELADVMAEAGITPYLQFGEVQWWYFRENRSGMPFYDEYTKATFLSRYGREIGTILEHTPPPAQFPEEVEFLPALIGEFTNEVISFVKQTHPSCRFEVLYPLDVNETAFNRAINFPAAAWSPATLDCLKTESFGFTYARNLDKSHLTITLPFGAGFPPSRSAFLVGISDPVSPWQKEVMLARAEALESIVLFALDQFCLIGYPAPLPQSGRRSGYQG